MTQVVYYLSTLSPWCYLAGTRAEEAAARQNAGLEYRPMDLLALFARTGGTAPAERHPSRNRYRAQELVRQAEMQGMKINIRPAHWPTNPAPSSYAIIAAQKAGGGDMGALVHGILRACWAEERDIAADDVIRDCLTGAGFDAGLADSGMLSGAETYAANLERAVEDGAFGAPFYITPDDERFWGQDRIDALERHLGRTA